MFTRAGLESFPKLWRVTAAIAFAAAIPRFYWMLTGQYNAVIIIFILFAILPFVLLTPDARRETGFNRISLKWILIAFVLGVAASAVVYIVGYALFANSEMNWYVVIMQTFNKDNLIAQVRPNPLLFVAFSLPVMIFSPLGEEFFFRGILHESFARKFSAGLALAADASFFGITHLAHYGLSRSDGGIQIMSSALPWIVMMAGAAVVFYYVRQKSGSIWGAVVAHAGFNFAMMFIIFYVIN